jgi:nucleotide-binding universal stress UspA family protein
MVEIRNILCAVDFSEISPRVASYTETLAKALSAKVHVIHVAPSQELHGSFEIPMPSIQGYIEEIASQAEKKMGSFIQENFKMADAKGRVLRGYADEEILSYAMEEHADLIVIGTHGRKGPDRVLFGAIAEKVVKASKIPVLTIRPE